MISMVSIWRALEELPTGCGTAADWQHFAGAAWPAWQRGFLDQRSEPATHCFCPHECGCAHRVVQHASGRIAAVCECDPWNCDDIPLTASDVVEWELNRGRLARALCRALELERREQDLGLPGTQQVATFSATAVPVILTIQQERHEFRQVVAELASRWREGYILFTPTSRFVDGRVHELLSHARAKFFDLESHVTLLPDGTLHAPKRAGEIFAQFVTNRDDGASDQEAVRVFVILQKLRSKRAGLKAALYDVFMLIVVDGVAQRAAAKKLGCSLGLISARVEELEREFKRSVAQLQALATELVEMQTSIKGEGKRNRKVGSPDARFADADRVYDGESEEEDIPEAEDD
jgi:hypothetical protein